MYFIKNIVDRLNRYFLITLQIHLLISSKVFKISNMLFDFPILKCLFHETGFLNTIFSCSFHEEVFLVHIATLGSISKSILVRNPSLVAGQHEAFLFIGDPYSSHSADS